MISFKSLFSPWRTSLPRHATVQVELKCSLNPSIADTPVETPLHPTAGVSGGAEPTRFRLLPLREPFTIFPGSNYAEDGWRLEWLPRGGVPGLTYWWRMDHMEDDNRKMEHAVRFDATNQAFEVNNAPSYRLLSKSELTAITTQHKKDLGDGQ